MERMCWLMFLIHGVVTIQDDQKIHVDTGDFGVLMLILQVHGILSLLLMVI